MIYNRPEYWINSSNNGETWCFNSFWYQASDGYNRFNSTPVYVSFTSGNVHFSQLSFKQAGSGLKRRWMMYYDELRVAEESVGDGVTFFVDDDYRTIILNEPATGDLLEYLENNATKIS